MWWVLLFVLLGTASLALLGWLTWGLWKQVRQLGRDVSRATERLAEAQLEISRLAGPAPRR